MISKVSVAMAVYNGEKYLNEQIDSIIGQLKADDELIISVDPCGDTSKQIALEYAANDVRIRVVDGPGDGVVSNFENALKQANGDCIFLSDQDDMWEDGKIDACVAALEDGALAVIHDCTVVDSNGSTLHPLLYRGTFKPGAIRNIIKNRYTGCCMAINRALLQYAMPFPDSLPMHDQWLGIAAAHFGRVAYIDRPLIKYRRHECTATGRQRAGIMQKLKWRIAILRAYIGLGLKRKNHEQN